MFLRKITKMLIVAATMFTVKGYAADFKCEALIKACSSKLNIDKAKMGMRLKELKENYLKAKFSVSVKDQLITIATRPDYKFKKQEYIYFLKQLDNMNFMKHLHKQRIAATQSGNLLQRATKTVKAMFNCPDPRKSEYTQPAFTKDGKAVISLNPETFIAEINCFIDKNTNDLVLFAILEELCKTIRYYSRDKTVKILSVCMLKLFYNNPNDNMTMPYSCWNHSDCKDIPKGKNVSLFELESKNSKAYSQKVLRQTQSIQKIVMAHLEKQWTPYKNVKRNALLLADAKIVTYY